MDPLCDGRSAVANELRDLLDRDVGISEARVEGVSKLTRGPLVRVVPGTRARARRRSRRTFAASTAVPTIVVNTSPLSTNSQCRQRHG